MDHDFSVLTAFNHTELPQLDALSSLEAVLGAKGATASVPGPVDRAASPVFRQAATEWLLDDEEHESQAGSAALTEVPGVDSPVRTESGQGLGCYVNIMAGAHRAHVALQQVQWDHRRIPHQNGEALAQSVWVQEL